MKSLSLRSFKWLAFVFVFVFGIGCGPSYSYTEFGPVVAGELDAKISGQAINIPVAGIAMTTVKAINSDKDPMGTRLESDDSTILQVEPGQGDNEWVFIGRRVGKTRVYVIADGERATTIPTDVLAQ